MRTSFSACVLTLPHEPSVWSACLQVEDGNDLLMAIDTVKDVHKFMSRLQQHAAATGEEEYALYRRLVEF